MATRNSALLLMLLLGAFGSCASAYYFPNGPPNRPSRQASDSDDGPLVPEPRQLLPDTPEVPKIIQLEVPPVPVSRESRQADDQEKPEPRPFPGIQMVPEEKRDPTRQSDSCQQSYSFTEADQSAQIQSPNYPREYPNNYQTSVCFTSPSGTTMSVNCDDFNVESAPSCSYDYFGIGYDGSPSNIQKYCGRGILSSPASTGNSLAIVFKSDGSNPGWLRSAYRFRCRVTVSGSSEATTTSAPAPPPSPPSSGEDCNCGKRNDGSRIVGGQDADLNEFPWRCYLRTSTSSFFCGCSIISPKWILTAAHCTEAVRGSTISVVVGDHVRSTTAESVSQTIRVDKVVQHLQYNPQTYDNDVSLLRLSQSVTYSNSISPTCLPFKYRNDDFNGTTVSASGWGTTTERGQVSDILQEVDLPVLTTEQCSAYYPGQITENMICTYEPGKDTCQGDSGGSIDLNRDGRYYSIGVVSWGIGCARDRYPGVYAKSTKYLDWIKDNSEGETYCEA